MLVLLSLAACEPAEVKDTATHETGSPADSDSVTDSTNDSATDSAADTAVDSADTGRDSAIDTAVDTDTAPDPYLTDDDGDGFSEDDGDCDDADPTLNPAATERCDGVDQDCDGEIDDPATLLGSDASCPGRSCLGIQDIRTAAADGNYWIDLAGVPTEVVCDMTRDTGGWTLVANFVWPGNTGGVAGWTSGAAVGTTTTDTTQSFKLDDADINALVTVRYRARGTASYCTLEDRTTGACTVDTTLYWADSCVYTSGSTSTGDCTAAYQTYDLDGWTELSNPCSWHYGLTSADCGVTSEFGTSHDGEHVFAGIVGTYIHGYDGRDNEDPSVEVWVR